METTWIFIIIGILILFFLLSHTIYITTSTVQNPSNGCGVSTYGCCPDKITSRSDALGSNCTIKSSTTASPRTITSPPSSTTTPSPYVAQNVANTTPYPPTQSTILVPIQIPTPATPADQQQLPPKATPLTH